MFVHKIKNRINMNRIFNECVVSLFNSISTIGSRKKIIAMTIGKIKIRPPLVKEMG